MQMRGLFIVVLALGGIFFFSGGIVSAADVTIDVASPLTLTKVDDLFGKILSYLQTVIVTIALIFLLIGGFLYITSGGDSGRIETAKNSIFYALLGLALALAAPAFIKQIYDILGAGAAPIPPGGTALSVLQIAQNVLDFLLAIIGVIAIIMLVVGGLMYLTAAGDEDRIDTGKKITKYSMIGIAIALSSIVLIRLVASLL
ncbi:MAG: hypothetical protein ACEQSB_03395 [Undibacterium sp.]